MGNWWCKITTIRLNATTKRKKARLVFGPKNSTDTTGYDFGVFTEGTEVDRRADMLGWVYDW